MPDQLIEAVTGHLSEIISESKALRDDVHAAERARRRTATYNLAVLIVLTLGLTAVLAVGWQNNRLSRQVAETNRRMADCTTPGGDCYEQGRQRTGSAIADIIRTQVYVTECARLYPGESGPEYDRKVEACVAARLAAGKSGPLPSPSAGR